jgi:hypothetical protein
VVCPVPSVVDSVRACDFEKDFCGWIYMVNKSGVIYPVDDPPGMGFAWHRRQGLVDNPASGPGADHTSCAGHYASLDSSSTIQEGNGTYFGS